MSVHNRIRCVGGMVLFGVLSIHAKVGGHVLIAELFIVLFSVVAIFAICTYDEDSK